MPTDRPWSFPAQSTPAIGLVEAVLRTAWVESEGAALDLCCRARGRMERTVREWQAGVACTPEQWAELKALIQQRGQRGGVQG